jgi:hypothetical protein
MIVGPSSIPSLPEQVARYLDGADLLGRAGQAFQLSTVDEAGWPRSAHLSIGEVLATDAHHLNLCLWAHSGTCRNMARDGRATLSLVLDGGVFEIQLRTTPVTAPQQRSPAPAMTPGDHADEPQLAFFRATVESTKEHRAKYAEVTTGVSYRLHSPHEVLARWTAQISWLRNIT